MVNWLQLLIVMQKGGTLPRVGSGADTADFMTFCRSNFRHINPPFARFGPARRKLDFAGRF